jgi:hypothetical protein
VLLDERLLEGHGDAIAAKSNGGVEGLMRSRIIPALLLVLLTLSAALPNTSQAQQAAEAERWIASLKNECPDLHALLTTLERAHGVLYGALARDRGKVQQSDIYRLLARRVTEGAASSRPDPEAEAGYAVLGARGAEVIRRTHAFHREILAIYASLGAAAGERALDEAVARYRRRPEVALPDVPKDMGILYDHPYTWSFKTTYPDLNGFVWATHWFQLAALEPLEVYTTREERLQGLRVVTDRFHRKLSFGTPPDAFPTELPLAPSIAPGLVAFRHPRAAAIIDNLNMMHDVLADVLVHPEVDDVRAALDEVIDRFTDPDYRVVEVDNWIVMALRHSIFNQGGPALGTMTQSERNGSGHLQHFGRGRAIIPGMR